jgi:SAM-dependent methyltransferase
MTEGPMAESNHGNAANETEWWDLWNRRDRAATVDPLFVRLGQVVMSEVRSLPVRRPDVLEIGCGTGWFAEGLSGFRSYLGLDLSPEAVAIAKQRLPALEFVAGDFHDWEPPPLQFDVAVLLDTVAYFRDQDLALAKVVSLLKPGGFVVLSTVNPFVYSRISWIGPPGDGQVRKWLSKSHLRALRTLKHYTIFPSGDRGILRLINTPRLNKPLEAVIPEGWIRRTKESLGLGRFQIVVAQRSL